MSPSFKFTKVNLYDFLFANKTRKTYSSLTFTIVLVIVLLVFALRPTILTVEQIKLKTKEYQDINAKLEAKIEASKTLQSQLNLAFSENEIGLKDEIEFMDSAFMKDTNLKNFYFNIQERAKADAVIIQNVQPEYLEQNTIQSDSFELSEKAPSNNFYGLNFTAISNDLDKLQHFIGTLESSTNFPVVSRIDRISVSAQTDTTGRNILNYLLNISFVIYIDQTRVVVEEPPVTE